MKKIIALILAIISCAFILVGCTSNKEKYSDDEPIGYALVVHPDGEEHIEVYAYNIGSNHISFTLKDGSKIITGTPNVIFYKNPS